jgi:hypothetical protein
MREEFWDTAPHYGGQKGTALYIYNWGQLQILRYWYVCEPVMHFVDVVSSDILSRNGKSVTMQDQSQGRTRRVLRLVRALRRVKTLRPVLLYYEM